MGKGMNKLAGKITSAGSMYVEAEHKTSAKKPTVAKGGDLRAKGSK